MLPTHRIPTHPGEILLEEFLRPLDLTQVALADHLGLPVQRINELVRGKRGVTPETAWLLSQAFGTTPEFWVTVHHFRDRAGAEVDVVLEAADGRVAAVEVKAGRSVGRREVRSLSMLRDRVGDDFVNGVVLGCIEAPQPLGDRLTAMPLSALWS